MKLHPESLSAYRVITGYGSAFIEVDGKAYTHSIIVVPDQPVRAWSVCNFDALMPMHFDACMQAASRSNMPELLLFGSGSKLRFPPVQMTESLIKHRLAFEVMDAHAACRTYNILVAEGRRVVAALLVETDG